MKFKMVFNWDLNFQKDVVVGLILTTLQIAFNLICGMPEDERRRQRGLIHCDQMWFRSNNHCHRHTKPNNNKLKKPNRHLHKNTNNNKENQNDQPDVVKRLDEHPVYRVKPHKWIKYYQRQAI